MLHRRGSERGKARVPVTRYTGRVTSQPGPVGCKQIPAILSSKLVGATAEEFSLQNANNAVVVKFYMCRIMTWNIKRKKKNVQLPRAGHIIISFFPLSSSKPTSQFWNDRLSSWRKLTVKVLTVNGDTALLWGHWAVLSPLFLEKNQTVPWRTAACLTVLAAPTQCTCTSDTKERLCFLSVLAGWVTDVLHGGGVGRAQHISSGPRLRGASRGGRVELIDFLCICFSCSPSLALCCTAERREEHQREIQEKMTAKKRKKQKKQTKGKVRSKVRALRTVKRRREDRK